MGQAKARGTKDQRIIEGEQKAREREIARKRAAAEYEASLSPEIKKKRHDLQILLGTMMGMMSTDDLRTMKAVNMLRHS